MKIPRWIYRYRGVLLAPPLLLALFSTFRETESRLVWPIGIAIVLLGTGIRVLAQQMIHHRMKARQDLTTTGLYAIIRNPLYVANTVLCLGAVVVSREIWFVPIMLLYCCGLYALVVRYEEACLLKEYGEPYRKYLSEVPRWLPGRLRFRNGGPVNPHFFRALVAESPCLLILLPYIIKDILS
ncbi:MAG: isoprenylcysteine carboxylmethyltransferase family protein [Candidatus Ratteibacteria bacterium]|jgi:protein-S-isoprenylcysteine O-methyltransferase Ste14